jgi:hypothetical protein
MKKQVTDKWEYHEVETALCLWEAVLNFHWCSKGEEKQQLEQMFSDHGSFTMRAAIAGLADDCDKAWEAHAALTGTITSRSTSSSARTSSAARSRAG